MDHRIAMKQILIIILHKIFVQMIKKIVIRVLLRLLMTPMNHLNVLTQMDKQLNVVLIYNNSIVQIQMVYKLTAHYVMIPQIIVYKLIKHKIAIKTLKIAQILHKIKIKVLMIYKMKRLKMKPNK
jgi:hypothetical protein